MAVVERHGNWPFPLIDGALPAGVYDYGRGDRHPDDPGQGLAECVDADTGEVLQHVGWIDEPAGTVGRLAMTPEGRIRLTEDRRRQPVWLVESRRVAFRPKADEPLILTRGA